MAVPHGRTWVGAQRRLLATTTLAGCLLAPMAATSAAEPAGGQAVAQADRRWTFAIPAQDLSSGLMAFAKQTGIQVVFKSEDLAGLKTGGLTGEMSAEEGLRRMLEPAIKQAIQTASVDLEKASNGLFKNPNKQIAKDKHEDKGAQGNGVSGLLDTVGGMLGDGGNGGAGNGNGNGNGVGGASNGIGGAVSGLATGLGGTVSGAAGGVGGAVSSLASGVGSSLGGGLGSTVSGVGGGLGSTVGGAGGTVGSTVSGLGGAVGGLLGGGKK